MSTVIDQPRNDVPIVSDTTLLSVPSPLDEAGRLEYLKKIRSLRNATSEKVESGSTQPQPEPEMEQAEVDAQPVDDEVPQVQEAHQDAIDTPSTRTRLSQEDLKDYEIPVMDEDGNIQYLSYDEFQKTVGLYSKQNKRARELAEREREVEALKTRYLETQGEILHQASTKESEIATRYKWVQDSLAFAHQHNVEVIKFDDGTLKKVTQLIAEKTALENEYTKLMEQKQKSLKKLEEAHLEFIQAQDKILDERAPSVKKNRSEIAKFLERQGFTPEESKALSTAKAELLLVLDKAMRYDAAQGLQPKEKKVGSNTKVIKQPSRLAGRGTPVNTVGGSRMQELQKLGTKATPDQLRELRRLQLQNK